MKVKRILSLILSLTLMLTGVVSVSLAETENPENGLESDTSLSVIMEDEAEIEFIAEDLKEEPIPEDDYKDDIQSDDEPEPVKDEEVMPLDEDGDSLLIEPPHRPEGTEETTDEEITEEPAEEATEEPAQDPAEEPAEEPVETPVEEPAEDPVDEPMEEPAEEPAEEPTDDPDDNISADQPAEKPTEAPADEPAEEPAEEPADEHAEEPEEIPDEEPADETSDEEEPEELPPHQAGDFVHVTKDTRVFLDMDKTDEANRITSELFVGVFVRDVHFVNYIASYLYESPKHGDMIIGNAMIVKQDGEDLRLLTQDEAIDLAKDMSQIRNVSIHEMTEFLSNLKHAERQPEKSISTILRMGSEKGNRQPCRSEGQER